MACIEARGLRKAFGTTIALDGVNLRVEEGRILGLIGPNGAGKTTALNAILGLTPYQGELNVLGRDPWSERDQLMRDVCFIADVAVLPRWMRVSQALDYVAGVHPRFDRTKAEGFLAKTTIGRTRRVRDLSKGMVTQLHLALVMAIDARLLVLDEPTLGLDILFRKQFYDSQSQHGRVGVALSGSDGASGAGRGGTSAQTDARAPGDRWQHSAIRWGGSSATGNAWRRAHAQHRRLVRCGVGEISRAIRPARHKGAAK